MLSDQSSSLTGTVVIIGATVDTKQVLFYKEDGTTFVIQQGDARLAEILQKVLGGLTYPGAKVTIQLTKPETDVYQAYEKKSGWGVKFFKVAKSFLAGVLKAEEPELPIGVVELVPQTVGQVATVSVTAPPVPPLVPAAPFVDQSNHVAEQAAREKLAQQIAQKPETVPSIPKPPEPSAPVSKASAVAEIMAHAQTKSTSDPTFNDTKVGDDQEHTVVAIVDNQVIGNAEALKNHMAHAVKTGSTKGMDNFYKRIAKVISKRRFSVDDLLKFMNQGDLPVTDDGLIVIYKVLKTHGDGPDRFVDCHTGKVRQKVGSFVCMSEDMVDPDRRQACSNGLHVATRRYIGGFSGDVICIGVVRPEDVIAVPEYDTTKMRVSGYHLVFKLDTQSHSAIRDGRAFTEGAAAQRLLGRVLSGDFLAYDQIVRIGGGHGTSVTYTDVPKVKAIEAPSPVPPVKVAEDLVQEAVVQNDGEVALVRDPTNPMAPLEKPGGTVTGRVTSKTSNVEEVEKAKPRLAEAIPHEGEVAMAKAVDPKQVAQAATAAKAATETAAVKAKRLYDDFTKAKSNKAKKESGQALLDFKKTAKKGWAALGLPADTTDVLNAAVKE